MENGHEYGQVASKIAFFLWLVMEVVDHIIDGD